MKNYYQSRGYSCQLFLSGFTEVTKRRLGLSTTVSVNNKNLKIFVIINLLVYNLRILNDRYP